MPDWFAANGIQTVTPPPAAAPPPAPAGPETDVHGNRIVRNPDGSIKFLQGPGFRGNADLSPDRNIADIGGIGIAPEHALMGLQVGRAVLKPGLALTGRAAELAAHVAPVVKYEIAKHTLTALGIPESVATVAAVAVSGYQRGGGKAAPAATAGEGAVSAPGFPRGTRVEPAPVSGEPVPGATSGGPSAITPAAPPQLGTPVGQTVASARAPVASAGRDVNAAPAPAPARAAARSFNPSAALADARRQFATLGETPRPAEVSNALEYIRRGESAEDAVAHVIRLRPAGSAPEAAAPVPTAAAKPSWTAEEVAFGQRLMAGGKTEQQAIDAILAQRALLQVPGTQSNAAVRAALDARNARGEIKAPSAATAATRRR